MTNRTASVSAPLNTDHISTELSFYCYHYYFFFTLGTPFPREPKN